jgi:hypothetical protein
MATHRQPHQNNSLAATSSGTTTTKQMDPAVVRQMITRHHKGQKINPDALLVSSELIRLFIVEARERAKVEAEYDAELLADHENINGNDGAVNHNATTRMVDGTAVASSAPHVDIQGTHIVKIATELLMDFS